MKVLVVGAGDMGSGFVKQLTAAGHQVSVTARSPAKALALGEQYGAQAVNAAGAAAGLNIYFGYGAGLGTSIAPTWIRKN